MNHKIEEQFELLFREHKPNLINTFKIKEQTFQRINNRDTQCEILGVSILFLVIILKLGYWTKPL
ncbi:hypothetical protein AAJ76_1000166313 [Vairimorpha ceranae]|uniref:Uncharacterized protein n=1 Tax=Vairimorpha ceranae TaxID=40302 RepID=A0A0F9WJK9_9MICR|nr:hypothetical protein AAJ76_1000166313 [Vairimorpha ceranae]KKO76715.1 hypothetical protein AAJ76_1000166313 [Vairimorpha ceranae]